MTRTSDAARLLGKKRWEGVSDEERTEHQRAAAKAYWAKLTEEERSAESKRRAAKRKPKVKPDEP